METYYREVEKLRDSAIQGGGCSPVQCKSVIQCVKAVCATLYKIETVDIIRSIEKLQKLASQVVRKCFSLLYVPKALLRSTVPLGMCTDSFVTSKFVCSCWMISSVVQASRRRSAPQSHLNIAGDDVKLSTADVVHLDDLHIALEDLTRAVKSQIDLFCRTFHTDYRFESTIPTKKGKDNFSIWK